jgi:iron(III) transport system substrate-binding protein
MRFPLHFLLFLILAFSPLIPPYLHAQSTQHSALVEGAKKEGKLVWYTSMAIDTSKPLLDAFVKEYPFIKVDLVRAGKSN